jgi:hypothetical protein
MKRLTTTKMIPVAMSPSPPIASGEEPPDVAAIAASAGSVLAALEEPAVRRKVVKEATEVATARSACTLWRVTCGDSSLCRCGSRRRQFPCDTQLIDTGLIA